MLYCFTSHIQIYGPPLINFYGEVNLRFIFPQIDTTFSSTIYWKVIICPLKARHFYRIMSPYMCHPSISGPSLLHHSVIHPCTKMWFPQAKTSLCVSDECKLPHIMINPHRLHCCSTSKPSLFCSAVMLGLGLCRPLSCSSSFLLVSGNSGHYRRTVSWRKNKELSPSYLPSSFPSAWPSHGSH